MALFSNQLKKIQEAMVYYSSPDGFNNTVNHRMKTFQFIFN